MPNKHFFSFLLTFIGQLNSTLIRMTRSPFHAVVFLCTLLGGCSALKCGHCVCKKDCEQSLDNSRTCPADLKSCFVDVRDAAIVKMGCLAAKGTDGQKTPNTDASRHFCDTASCNKDLGVSIAKASSASAYRMNVILTISGIVFPLLFL